MKNNYAIILFLTVVSSLLLLTGCGGPGQAITRAERDARFHRHVETSFKQLPDDIDRLLLYDDRPDRTSYWYVR